jgi:DNA-binding transcriptional ArsR family regulator
MHVAAAISDPTRRQIMTLLRDRSLGAGAIADNFEVSRPAVSRHLRVLRECGLVVDERRGRERLYRLDKEPLAALETWLEQFRDPWPGRLMRSRPRCTEPAAITTGSPRSTPR